MDIIARLKEWAPAIFEWRQDIHAHPENAFEGVCTSDLVADKLESFGIEVHRGLANTGVILVS
jgi:hippurate hydrolase